MVRDRSFFQKYKGVLLFAFVLLGVVTVAIIRFASSPSVPVYVSEPKSTSTPAELLTVQRVPATQGLEVRGRVAPVREGYLFFPMQGWLKEVHITLGQRVQEGDLIAELDAWELQNQVVEARHAVEMRTLEISRTLAGPSHASITFAQAEVAKAQVELDRVKIEARQSISETAQGLALAQVGGASPKLVSAEVHLDRAKIMLAKAQDAYKKALDRPWEAQIIRDELAEELHYAELEVRLAEAEVASAEAGIAQRAMLVRYAEEDMARAAELADQQIATAQADLALAQARLEQLVAPPRPESLNMLRAQLAQAQENLARLQTRLAETRLYAPFDGTILSLEAQVGDQVKAYTPVGAVGDSSGIQVLAFVPEGALGAIEGGMPVSVVLDSDLERVHRAHIQQVASQPVTWQGKTAYEVTIAFDEPAQVPAVVRAGCDVYVPTDTEPDRLVIPRNALYSVGNLTYVDVLQDGEVSRTLVQVGASTGDLVEIVSGLREGQTIHVY
jgi:macrolide-specific efflux system membrane fusion protein